MIARFGTYSFTSRVRITISTISSRSTVMASAVITFTAVVEVSLQSFQKISTTKLHIAVASTSLGGSIEVHKTISQRTRQVGRLGIVRTVGIDVANVCRSFTTLVFELAVIANLDKTGTRSRKVRRPAAVWPLEKFDLSQSWPYILVQMTAIIETCPFECEVYEVTAKYQIYIYWCCVHNLSYAKCALNRRMQLFIRSNTRCSYKYQ